MITIFPEDAKATSLEAYVAMIRLIEEFNKHLQSDDINSLLSALSLTTFGYYERSADPALWIAWEKCLKDVLIENESLKESEMP